MKSALVIKYGGNAMTDPSTRLGMAQALKNLTSHKPIVIHGGGPFIEAALNEAKLEHRFINGLRVTSEESLPIIERALTLLGKALAQEIGPAIGLTGRDARLFSAILKDEALGFVGTVKTVNTELIKQLLANHIIPVIACIAANEDYSGVLNVNADEVAGAVAGALSVPAVFLTNVVGVLDDPSDPSSLQRKLTKQDIAERIADGRISGGMIPKVQAALDALDQGASYAIIADGRDPSLLQAAIDGKTGTSIVT